ncbi:MAG: NAD(P)-binding domain-containing protein [Rhodocyclales bacterium]|nr:NAD(P)-binding domain-containing protein [Rhodocyclales bacterium]
MNDIYFYLFPVAFILLVTYLYWRGKQRRYAAAAEVLNEAIKSGLTEPSSLHPVIDPNLCCGSGACVRVCPEKALGLINHKAVLINPAHCIGHGACAPVCPVGAVKLVFGTEKRGIDIPHVQPNFETNVPGIYIAGELGGMGLVRKAAEQGRQAMESIAKNRGSGKQLDVVIVGAGPAGLAATLGAMEKKLRSVTLEQEDSLGGTVYHYPRNKLVMTQPVILPIVGKAKLGEISKEDLLAFWHGIVKKTGMKLNFHERVEKVTAAEGGYMVKSNKAEYFTRNVLLAIGRRGTQRKLGVPGEESSKVVYRLIDPEQYSGKRVLVVGGGDSAIEAAVATAEQPGTNVILSYRSNAFGRVKQKNRERLEEAEKAGKLTVLLSSTVARIEPGHVHIDHDGKAVCHENDGVIVCAGGILPTGMLKEMGIKVETKYGTE